jgi:hypothetical protein
VAGVVCAVARMDQGDSTNSNDTAYVSLNLDIPFELTRL